MNSSWKTFLSCKTDAGFTLVALVMDVASKHGGEMLRLLSG